MRTTIAIDEKLLNELMRVEGEVSRSEAIRRAIEAYLRRKKIDEFLTLSGSGLVDLSWQDAEREDVRKMKKHGRKR